MKRITERDLIILLIILIVKVVILLYGTVYLSENFPHLYQIDLFADDYAKIAHNLLNGNGYRIFPETAKTLYRGPGYVFLLAGIFYLFGEKLFIVQIINMMLTLATAAVLFQFAQRFISRKGPLLLIVFIFLLHPAIILTESRGAAEDLFIFFIVTFILFIYKAFESGKLFDFIAAGIALGISCLIKSTPIIMPFFVVGYLFISKDMTNNLSQKIKGATLFLLSMIVILLPWIYRNYLLSGKIIPTTTIAGSTAYQGLYYNKHINSQKNHYQIITDAVNNLSDLAERKGLQFRKGFFQYFYNTQDEIYFNKYVLNLVKKEYLNSPLLMAKSAILNLRGFWFQGRTKTTTILNTIVTMPLLLFAIYGMFIGYKSKLNLNFLVIFICVFISVYLPFLGVSRYQTPLIPFMLIFALIPFDKKLMKREIYE